MHENTRSAIAEGRRRWVERMREAKAQGKIERFPGGRRKRGLPPLSKDRTIRRAQRIIEAAMADAEKLTAMVGQKPWEEMSRGEKLAANANKALDVAAKILELDVDANDPTDFKRLALQKDMAVQVIGYQIRVEQGAQPFSPPASPAVTIEELAARAEREIDEAFREYVVPGTEHQSADAPAVLPPPPAQQEADNPARDYALPRRDMRATTLDDVISRGRARRYHRQRPGSAWGV
jgi:hypothetical protein